MAAPLTTSRANEGGAAPSPEQGARRVATALLFLAAVALPCLVLYHAVAPAGVLSSGPPPCCRGCRPPRRRTTTTTTTTKSTWRATARTRGWSGSSERRRWRMTRPVILTTLNSAWSEPGSVVDVFLESFWIGEDTRELLDHLVIVSLDATAHRQCKQIHTHCLAVATEGVDFSGQKNFMSDGYLRMMWRRIDFLRLVLEMGFSFIFTDTDIVWFRSPLPRLYADGDFQIACDHFTGDPDDLGNMPNGGFTYVRANSETVDFYKYWYEARVRHPGRHDQDVLNIIKRDPYLAEIGIRIRFLSTEFFGGLCEPSRNLSAVCTMHTNCCVGLRRKINDLNVMLHDWRRFMSTQDKDKHTVSWSVPQTCRFE